MDRLGQLLDQQDGVVSRRQALSCGLTPTAIARKIRRGDWVTVHDGVYIHHNGPPTWRQRAWAAVLVAWPAALSGRSALRAHEGPGRRGADEDEPIEVVVARDRRIKAPAGVVVRRVRRFDRVVQWNLSPPRMRYDDAILDLADRAANDLTSIAVLADACGGRRTTAERLRARLDTIRWVRRRDWLAGILDDLAAGTCSVLEHGYLTLVERAHGLPQGLRQVEATDRQGRRMFRGVRYGGERPRWRQLVELDGRLGHSTAQDRDRDLERDLDAALDEEHTVRLGYGQVFERHSRTALKLDSLFRRRGWSGVGHACPHCPPGMEWGVLDHQVDAERPTSPLLSPARGSPPTSRASRPCGSCR